MAGRPKLRPGEVRSAVPRQRDDGAWEVRAYVVDAGGQRRNPRGVGVTADEALAELHRKARELAHEPDALTKDTPLAVLVDLWLADRAAAVRPQSLRGYRDTARWLVPMAGALTVRDLTTQRIKKLLASIAAERTPAAADRARVALSGSLGIAVEGGAMRHNPVRSLRRRHVTRKPPTTLTVAQVNVLRRLVRERAERSERFVGVSAWLLPRAMEVALGSGLRVSEITALRNLDVDLDAGTITVVATTVDDESYRSVRQEGLKRLTQARVIELPGFAVRELRAARAAQLTVSARLPQAPAISGRRDNAAQPRNLRRTLRAVREHPDLTAALAVTGLTPADVTPHLFRRTAATLAAAAAGDLEAARLLLGHSEIRTTRTGYAGTAYRQVGSAAVLEELLGEAAS